MFVVGLDGSGKIVFVECMEKGKKGNVKLEFIVCFRMIIVIIGNI